MSVPLSFTPAARSARWVRPGGCLGRLPGDPSPSSRKNYFFRMSFYGIKVSDGKICRDRISGKIPVRDVYEKFMA